MASMRREVGARELGEGTLSALVLVFCGANLATSLHSL